MKNKEISRIRISATSVSIFQIVDHLNNSFSLVEFSNATGKPDISATKQVSTI
jgi:hypothetical protein